MIPKVRNTLSAEEWRRLSDYYNAGRSLEGEQLEAFLQGVKQTDPQLFPDLREFLSMGTNSLTVLGGPLPSRLLHAVASLEPPQVLEPGVEIAEFKIRKVLGIGAFATVYLATDQILNRDIALKISGTSFGKEGTILATLDHHGIVKVHSQGSDDETGLHYLCMQYVSGITLEALLKRLLSSEGDLNGQRLIRLLDHTLAPPIFIPEGLANRERLSKLNWVESVLHIGTQLAGALHYAHSRGVLHLDVKPANIILNPYGQPLLMDFNVSFRLNNDSSDLQSFGGTLEYMSPEQLAVFKADDKRLAVKKVDGRSDLYSLGIVLKQLIEKAGNPASLPTEAISFLGLATHPDPDRRFVSCKAFREAVTNQFKVRTIEANLPYRHLTEGILNRYPISTLALLTLFSHCIGAGVAVAHVNWIMKPALAPGEWQSFVGILLISIPVLFGLAAAVWVGLLYRLIHHIQETSYPGSADQSRACRKHVLSIANLGMLVPSIAWFSQLVLVPLGMYTLDNSLAPSFFRHAIQIVISAWIPSVTFCYFAHAFVVLWKFYPRALLSTVSVKDTARSELRNMRQRIQLCVGLLIVFPWIRALSASIGGGSELALLQTQRSFAKPGVPILLTLGFLTSFLAAYLLLRALHNYTSQKD